MFSSDKKEGFFDKFPSKTSFIMGLVTSLLLICTIGFFILLANFLGAGKNSLNRADSQNALAALGNQPDEALAAPTDLAKNLRPIGDSDHLRGNKKAKVTLVEFSDFQCPFCSKAHETLKQLLADYNGQVAWVYKHLPLDQLHPYARAAAEASECAAEQGKFWEYADELFSNQALLSRDYLTVAAANLGLNQANFEQCLNSGKYQGTVNDNEAEAQAVGVSGTPGIYVNDILIKGALPIEQFKQAIDSLL